VRKHTRLWRLFRDARFSVASIILVLFFALPVYYVVTGAFMTRAEVYAAAAFPARLQWENLRIALFDYGMLRYFRNSLFITLTIVALNLFFCSLSGFALAKYDFPGKNVLFAFVLVSMMIPPLAMIVPLFLEVRSFGWLNTPLAVIIPAFIDPFGIFLMRQYIVDISEEHLDAARVEGCSEFGMFWRVILPFSVPALSALLLYRFLFVWNDLFWPLLVLGEKWRTLPVAIEQFGAQHFAAQELQLTTSFVGALPILIILVLFTRQVFSAVSKAGGLK
jgi:ABC-type glycerol-3-phosphate transport system permease component